MKQCSKCKAYKPAAGFSKDAQKKDGLRSSCRECARPYNCSDAARASCKKWRTKYPEKQQASKRSWWERNQPPRRIKDLTAPARAKKNWKLRNPIMVRLDGVRRRIIELRAIPAWTNHVAIQEMYAFARLKTKLTGQPWHVDHIVPLRSKLVCGLHTHYNLQVISKAANHAKGNRYWPDMWNADAR